jgi:hypothetical protein
VEIDGESPFFIAKSYQKWKIVRKGGLNLAKRKLWTHSELQAGKDCLQKWLFAYQFGYTSRYLTPTILIGSGGHRGLEGIYRREPFGETVAGIKSIFSGYVEKNYSAIPEDLLPKYSEAAQLTVDVVTNYRYHWRGRDFKVATHPESGRPLIEVEFKLPVYTPAGITSRLFDVGGKIDLVVEEERELWIADHKFRLNIDADIEERMIIDQQLRLYAWAMTMCLGRPIAGAILNVVRRKVPGKPKINKDGTVSTAKMDTDVDTYIKAIEAQERILCEQAPAMVAANEGKKRPKKIPMIDWDKYAPEIRRLNGVKFFGRYKQRYTENDLMRAQFELYQNSLMIHQAKFYPQNDAACEHWGGCRFKPLCTGRCQDPMADYAVKKNTHAELDGDFVLKPVRKPYLLKDWDDSQTLGFKGTLERVNAQTDFSILEDL